MNTALDGVMIQCNINGEFKIQGNSKVDLDKVPQKEENTAFMGDRMSKGTVICSGFCVHSPCSRWK